MSNEEKNINLDQEEDYNELIKERRQKLAKLQAEGRDPFDVYKVNRTHSSKEVKDNYEELDGKTVTVAGRLMSKRVHGKAGFSDIHDRYGKIQLYIKINDVGEEKLKEFKSFDIGDLLSVTGMVFKTKTGETSIPVS